MMKLSTFNFCLVFCALVIIIAGGSDENNNGRRRLKRKVTFRKNSKFFFRLNGKDNVLNHTLIFAHGWGFRMNYDLPDNVPKRHLFFKRDIHNHLEEASSMLGSEVYSCILRYVCDRVESINGQEGCGMFCGIGNIIASPRNSTVCINSLDFSSKLRLNTRANIVNYTDIFVNAYVVRVNYDMPTSIKKRYTFFKRDIQDQLDEVPNVIGSEMYSCIFRFFCDHADSVREAPECGMFCGIGNIIARSKGIEAGFFKSFIDNCDYHTSNCPYPYNNEITFGDKIM